MERKPSATSTQTGNNNVAPVHCKLEQRIAKQKQLIAELKCIGCSTEQAGAELKDQLLELAMLRNHFDLSLELTRAGENRSVERRAQHPVLARKRDG